MIDSVHVTHVKGKIYRITVSVGCDRVMVLDRHDTAESAYRRGLKLSALMKQETA